MERSVEIFAAITTMVFGLSHLLQDQAWADYFIWLRSKGYPGVFINGLMSLLLGTFIVSFHNVWQGLPTVLTLVGWMQVLKGTLCLVVPRLGLWSLSNVSHERARRFKPVGIVLIALSCLFWYMAYSH